MKKRTKKPQKPTKTHAVRTMGSHVCECTVQIIELCWRVSCVHQCAWYMCADCCCNVIIRPRHISLVEWFGDFHSHWLWWKVHLLFFLRLALFICLFITHWFAYPFLTPVRDIGRLPVCKWSRHGQQALLLRFGCLRSVLIVWDALFYFDCSRRTDPFCK